MHMQLVKNIANSIAKGVNFLIEKRLVIFVLIIVQIIFYAFTISKYFVSVYSLANDWKVTVNAIFFTTSLCLVVFRMCRFKFKVVDNSSIVLIYCILTKVFETPICHLDMNIRSIYYSMGFEQCFQSGAEDLTKSQISYCYADYGYGSREVPNSYEIYDNYHNSQSLKTGRVAWYILRSPNIDISKEINKLKDGLLVLPKKYFTGVCNIDQASRSVENMYYIEVFCHDDSPGYRGS